MSVFLCLKTRACSVESVGEHLDSTSLPDCLNRSGLNFLAVEEDFSRDFETFSSLEAPSYARPIRKTLKQVTL